MSSATPPLSSPSSLVAKQVLQNCQGISYRAGVIKLRNALDSIDHAIQSFSTRTTEDLQRSGDLGVLSELRALKAQTEHNLRKAQELKEKGRAFLTNYKMSKKSNSKVSERGPTPDSSSTHSGGEATSEAIIVPKTRSPPPVSRSPPNHSPPNREMVARQESVREEMVRQEREIMRLRQQIEDSKLNDHKQKQQFGEQIQQLRKENSEERAKWEETFYQVNAALERKKLELKQVVALKDELEQQNLSLTKENANVDMAAETMQRISSETDNLNRENDRITHILEVTRREKKEIFDQLSEARTEVARLQAENEGLAAMRERTTPRSPAGDKGLSDDERKLLLRVKDIASTGHTLTTQLTTQTASILKQSSYTPLADSVHTIMKAKQAAEIDLKKKFDEILYVLNPVNQVIALSEPIVPDKQQGNGLTPEIKKLLKHRTSLINQVQQLKMRNQELLQAKKVWARRSEEVEEEKAMMLGKLRETISSLVAEKQRETSAREEIEEHCMELQEGLQIFREKFREQETQLRAYQNNIENFEKVKEHSEVIAEATSIQSIAIKKENDKLRRDCNEYQDRIQAMLTNKEGLTRQIRSQAQLIDEMKLEQVRMARRIKTLDSIEDGEQPQAILTGVEADELVETVEMLSNENESLRKEKYALQKQVDESDDKLNNMHMMIVDLENEKSELQTENEILKTTSKTNIQLPMIDPTDPRVSQRLDQFGLLPPPPGQSVLENLFEFLFPFLFEEEVV